MRFRIFALTIMVFVLAGSVYGQALPREILNSYVDQYFSALVAHDPDRLPLAPDARYTENGQTLELGDGNPGSKANQNRSKYIICNLKPDVREQGYVNA